MESVEAMRCWYLSPYKRLSQSERTARSPDGLARLRDHSVVATVCSKAVIRFVVDQPVPGGVAIAVVSKRTLLFERTATSS